MPVRTYIDALSIASQLVKEQKDICSEEEYDMLDNHLEELATIFFDREDGKIAFSECAEDELSNILSKASMTEYELLRALEFYLEKHREKNDFEMDLASCLKRNEDKELVQQKFLPRFMRLSLFARPEFLLQMGVQQIDDICRSVDVRVPDTFVSRFFSVAEDDEKEWDETCPCCESEDITCIEQPVNSLTDRDDGEYRYVCNTCNAVFVVEVDEDGFRYEPCGFIHETEDESDTGTHCTLRH